MRKPVSGFSHFAPTSRCENRNLLFLLIAKRLFSSISKCFIIKFHNEFTFICSFACYYIILLSCSTYPVVFFFEMSFPNHKNSQSPRSPSCNMRNFDQKAYESTLADLSELFNLPELLPKPSSKVLEVKSLPNSKPISSSEDDKKEAKSVAEPSASLRTPCLPQVAPPVEEKLSQDVAEAIGSRVEANNEPISFFDMLESMQLRAVKESSSSNLKQDAKEKPAEMKFEVKRGITS